jgi:hypothetical protein
MNFRAARKIVTPRLYFRSNPSGNDRGVYPVVPACALEDQVMQSLQRLLIPVALRAAGVVLELWYISSQPTTVPDSPKGPQTLEEVIPLVERLRLYHCSERKDGFLENRLIVSNEPVTWQRASQMVIVNPRHPCWERTIAICRNRRSFVYHYDPRHTVYWGDMFVIGDPRLILRVTGQRVESSDR